MVKAYEILRYVSDLVGYLQVYSLLYNKNIHTLALFFIAHKKSSIMQIWKLKVAVIPDPSFGL